MVAEHEPWSDRWSADDCMSRFRSNTRPDFPDRFSIGNWLGVQQGPDFYFTNESELVSYSLRLSCCVLNRSKNRRRKSIREIVRPGFYRSIFRSVIGELFDRLRLFRI